MSDISPCSEKYVRRDAHVFTSQGKKEKKKKEDVEVKRNAIGRVDHVEYTGLWLAN